MPEYYKEGVKGYAVHKTTHLINLGVIVAPMNVATGFFLAQLHPMKLAFIQTNAMFSAYLKILKANLYSIT